MKLVSGSGHNRSSKHAAPARRAAAAERPENSSGTAARPPKKKGKGWLIAMLVIIILVAVGFVYWKFFAKPVENEAPDLTGEQIADYDEERFYTLLVVGDDQEGGNTDTIMLLRMDTKELKVNVVSIPRDTLVNSPLNNKKINAIYHNLDGVESLMDEVEDITGFRPNNYVVVNTDVFVDVVNAMGGVDFYVPFDMDYDDYADHDGDGVCEYIFTIHVKEGQQTLYGYDAMGVFRWRQNNNGAGHVYGNPDIERIEMQHNLLMAIASKAMATRDAKTLMNIASAVLPKCKTDLTLANIGWYATKFLQMDMSNIEFFTMPTTGAVIKSASYVTINVDEWIDMVNTNFNPFDRMVTREDCEILYSSTTPALINGQYHIDPANITATNGAEVEKKFY